MLLLSSADVFQCFFFKLSECQMLEIPVGPDLGPNCLQKLSADKKLLLAWKELKKQITKVLSRLY